MVCIAALTACSGSEGNSAEVGLGGAATTLGGSGTFGTEIAGSVSGGTAPITIGGTVGVGGTTPSAGGSLSAGGSTSKGGSTSAGGSTSKGGSTASGGSSSAGGSTSKGGSTASGGMSSLGGSVAVGGTSNPSTLGCGAGTSLSGDIVVDLSAAKQKISGFGASTAWASSMSSTDADLLWSTTSGAGLSLHRIRIAPDGTTSETNIAKLAQARGATIWATPWSPTASYKSNNNVVMGTLTNGQAWATTLASFVTNMKNSGVNIYAVSAQNEPDADVTYESCSYTGASLASFIGTYLGPAIKATGAKVMGPETQNWCGFLGYADAIMNNSAAAANTDIIATHEYGCADAAHVVPYAKGISAGKEFWQTEIYDQGSATADPGMGSALRVYKLIHEALTLANMNAWHYWWVYPTTTDNGALWDKATNAATKRLWILGNFSRFVRPGFVRVATTGTVPSGVLLSAYKNPTDNTTVIVVANSNTSAASLSLFVGGAPSCTFAPWVTSASESLVQKAAITVQNSRLTYSLAPQSVTTFVGKP